MKTHTPPSKTMLGLALGGKGSSFAAQAQMKANEANDAFINQNHAEWARNNPSFTLNSMNPYQNVYPSSQPGGLEEWWDNLQRRAKDLGEDDMPYPEWAKWSDELDQFKKA